MYNVIINLICNTKTKTELEIRAEIDEKKYIKLIKIKDEDFSTINLKVWDLHGEWNCVIKPRN